LVFRFFRVRISPLIIVGMVFTPMVRGRGMTNEMRQARINQNLMKKEGDAWDVGNGKRLCVPLSRYCVHALIFQPKAILFLCSKEAKWITGVILPVDAGVSILEYMPIFSSINIADFDSDHGRKGRQTGTQSRLSGGEKYWHTQQQVVKAKPETIPHRGYNAPR